MGYVIAQKELIQRLTALRLVQEVSPNILNQLVVQEILRNVDRYEAHLEKVRTAYRKKREVMIASLKEHLPPEVVFTEPDGGMFIWLTIPGAVDSDIVTASLERGVAVVPGSIFTVDTAPTNSIRISFVKCSLEQIEEGVKILAGVIRESMAANENNQ
jgi:DNA-binding transcriptional MocR family regulator